VIKAKCFTIGDCNLYHHQLRSVRDFDATTGDDVVERKIDYLFRGRVEQAQDLAARRREGRDELC
jgi:hypothetical protein